MHPFRQRRIWLLTLWLLCAANGLQAQQARLPTVAEVQQMQKLYEPARKQAAHGQAVRTFMPGLSEAADAMARRAETALAGGRLLQASELIRQARWQLPYLPHKLPPHVSRAFGSFRLRHAMDITAVVYSP